MTAYLSSHELCDRRETLLSVDDIEVLGAVCVLLGGEDDGGDWTSFEQGIYETLLTGLGPNLV